MQPHIGNACHWIARARNLNTIYALLSISIFSAYLRYALANSWFMGQDFDHLILLQKETFAVFLKTPIDIHFPLPLHRLFCWFFYQELKMNFPAAISFLGIIFLCSGIYLYKLLQIIQPSRINPALITLYTGNIYLLDLFIWWSSGLHRFPYILSAIACCYHGLNYQKLLQKRDALLCLCFFFIAFGFFEKAILIPAYVFAVVIGDTLLNNEKIKTKSILLISLMGLISAIYSTALISSSNANHAVTKSPELFLATLQLGVKKSLQCLLPFRYNPLLFPDIPSLFPLIVTFSAGWLIYFALKKNTTALAISAAFFTLIVLNFLPIAASTRAELFSPLFVLLTRYYFENIFLALIFVAFICKSLRRTAIKPSHFLSRDIQHVTALAITTISLLIAYQGAVSTAQKEYQPLGGHQTAAYIRNLEAALGSPENKGITILDQPLPAFVYGSAATGVTAPLLSNLVAAWQFPVKVGDSKSAAFYVDGTGNLLRTR